MTAIEMNEVRNKLKSGVKIINITAMEMQKKKWTKQRVNRTIYQLSNEDNEII